MAQQATSNFGWQNKFSTTLTSGITASDTTIALNSLPTPSEGFLIIEPDSSTNWEVIYYTSKTGSAVVCTSAANGRGVDDSSAISHSAGAVVRMDTTSGMFEILQNMTAVTPGSAGGIAFASGWTLYPNTTPNTVTALGNRSYSMVFNSTDLTGTVSAGMRLRTTRTVAAPTQCTSLNGTTQYYSRASGSLGATFAFTDDFVVSAWIKPSSYANGVIASRYNGTSGWEILMESTGVITIRGYNAGAANFSQATSYQSVPLNKWIHVAAQLDMSTFTAATTTSYVMLDGVDVPVAVSRGGTNPVALVQAGNLEIGSRNGGSIFFPGKLAQVAIYSAKVTQATILASMHQTLAGTETSLISAYSFNNSINDLNANANNLTANGSAVATNADSPFGGQADGTISSTLDYAIITKTAFSTNTTLTVQVPEGCTIPTSGGVVAVSYSTQKAPYLMPVQKDKWRVFSKYRVKTDTTINTATAQVTGFQLSSLPIGEWKLYGKGYLQSTTASIAFVGVIIGLSTSTSSYSSDLEDSRFMSPQNSTATTENDLGFVCISDYSAGAQTTIYGVAKTAQSSTVSVVGNAGVSTVIEAENAYL